MLTTHLKSNPVPYMLRQHCHTHQIMPHQGKNWFFSVEGSNRKINVGVLFKKIERCSE
jgi:hypothetical protein